MHVRAASAMKGPYHTWSRDIHDTARISESLGLGIDFCAFRNRSEYPMGPALRAYQRLKNSVFIFPPKLDSNFAATLTFSGQVVDGLFRPDLMGILGHLLSCCRHLLAQGHIGQVDWSRVVFASRASTQMSVGCALSCVRIQQFNTVSPGKKGFDQLGASLFVEIFLLKDIWLILGCMAGRIGSLRGL